MEKNEVSIGDKVFFKLKNKMVACKIEKINPSKALVCLLDGMTKYRVSYSILNKESAIENSAINRDVIAFDFIPSSCTTNSSLKMLMDKIKKEYNHIIQSLFDSSEKRLLDSLRIEFGNQITYRKAGHYNHCSNKINITKSYRGIPEFVIEKTIWHEILHIHFNKSNGRQAHSKEFRYYEKLYSRYNEAIEFRNKLFYEIRYNGYSRINRIINNTLKTQKTSLPQVPQHFINKSIKASVCDTIKNERVVENERERIINELKRLNLFPSYMQNKKLDEWDYRFLLKKYNQLNLKF